MMPSGNVVSVVRASHPIMKLGGRLVRVLPCSLGFQFRLWLLSLFPRQSDDTCNIHLGRLRHSMSFERETCFAELFSTAYKAYTLCAQGTCCLRSIARSEESRCCASTELAYITCQYTAKVAALLAGWQLPPWLCQ